MWQQRVATNAGDGRALTRYEIERRLGQGGMAEVFLARAYTAAGFEKRVVIKRILPALSGDEAFVRMFLDEARLALGLDHPNIVQVFDVERRDGQLFYVMEFLDGCDVRELSRRLAERPPEQFLEHAVTIVHGVCSGLHHAHSLSAPDGRSIGVVHRDVSPHNVFVTRDGHVKLIDFGIAKPADRAAVTTSMLKGKFGYMSPEQALSEPLDCRSDVFSTAIVLYELTTGARLFDGDNDFEVLKQLIELPIPPPSQSLPGYPPELERIVMRGLERDLSRRYPSALELARDLERFAAARGLVLTSTPLAELMNELFGTTKHTPVRVRVPTPSTRAVPRSPAGRAPERETLSLARIPAPPLAPARSRTKSLALASLLGVLAIVALSGYFVAARVAREPAGLARLPLPDQGSFRASAPSVPEAERSETNAGIVAEQTAARDASPRPSPARRSSTRQVQKKPPKPPALSEKAVLDAPLPK